MAEKKLAVKTLVDLSRPHYEEVPVRELDGEALLALSVRMKLALSRQDMLVIREFFIEIGREPTDVELEVLAQTWSEHCKHRIFGAEVMHEQCGVVSRIDGLFKTYVKAVTDRIMGKKPGFVLSAFHDNAGFIRLDERHAACLKVETHNHPSAIEPYAGANTGLGGVIRDILGAGKGAKPVGSVDVFCFGRPDTEASAVKGDTIHPLGMMRGVVRGVRDYGNRMGIPTVAGAIQFHPSYTYNPLVYCGTAGVIENHHIEKKVVPGLLLLAVGGRTGRDGLRGATFSSASLDTESHEEDKGAVQIGNPIEEKKVHDFVLRARDEGLIESVTDCGAGGFSSAGGEMLSETGGQISLDAAPLKEPGLRSWEVLLSESQERMVLAIRPDTLPRLMELARVYETEAAVIGQSDESGRLRVLHHDRVVCDLPVEFLHQAPRLSLSSRFAGRADGAQSLRTDENLGALLRRVLGDMNVCSREPVIREYDHEVQGNTILKPLAGHGGDCPQDGVVIEVPEAGMAVAVGVALLPAYGELDPCRMGRVSVDEAIRQLVVSGADPDRIGILDNFCMGNPMDPTELGRLVESARGMAEAAEAFGAPFISGKDSFYNYYETDEGPISIPVSLLISAIGIVPTLETVRGASLRRPGSRLALVGYTNDETGGSIAARLCGAPGSAVPDVDVPVALSCYRALHEAMKKGWVLSAHDLSEGGLAVAAAEAGFSLRAGIDLVLDAVPTAAPLSALTLLFSETGGRILLEIEPEHVEHVSTIFAELPFAWVGVTTSEHLRLRITHAQSPLIDEPLETLKATWKNALTPYY